MDQDEVDELCSSCKQEIIKQSQAYTYYKMMIVHISCLESLKREIDDGEKIEN